MERSAYVWLSKVQNQQTIGTLYVPFVVGLVGNRSIWLNCLEAFSAILGCLCTCIGCLQSCAILYLVFLYFFFL